MLGSLLALTWQLEGAGGPRAGGGVGVGAAAGGRRGVGRVGRDGEGARVPAAPAVLREGFWEGGIEGHVRLVVAQVAELHQQAVLGVELAVAGHQDRGEHCGGRERETWCSNAPDHGQPGFHQN